MKKIIDADMMQRISVHEEVCKRLAEKRHQKPIINGETGDYE